MPNCPLSAPNIDPNNTTENSFAAVRYVIQAGVILGRRSTTTVYYPPRAVSPEDLALMKQIDTLYTEFLFAGSRKWRGLSI